MFVSSLFPLAHLNSTPYQLKVHATSPNNIPLTRAASFTFAQSIPNHLQQYRMRSDLAIVFDQLRAKFTAHGLKNV